MYFFFIAEIMYYDFLRTVCCGHRKLPTYTSLHAQIHCEFFATVFCIYVRISTLQRALWNILRGNMPKIFMFFKGQRFSLPNSFERKF